MQKPSKQAIKKYAKYLFLVYMFLWVVCLANYYSTMNAVHAAITNSVASGDARFSKTDTGEFAIQSFRDCMSSRRGGGFLNQGSSAYSSDECKVLVFALAKEKHSAAFAEDVGNVIDARLKYEGKIEGDAELMERLRIAGFVLKLMTFGVFGD